MKRINSIDTVRGISMWIMIYGHIVWWWLRPEDVWLRDWLYAFLKPIGATGFLLISGISAALAYRNNQTKLRVLNKINMRMVRNVYFLRAFFILGIGFIFNMFNALAWGNSLTDIWSWLVLQTIGFSLILSWPLLNTSKVLRIIIGILVILANQLLLGLLTPFKGQFNTLGVLYHLIFNDMSNYVILIYFGIFIIGTVIGDIIFDINVIDDQNKRKALFKNKFLIHVFLIGISIMTFGILFQFPNFWEFNSISSICYSVGIILVTLSGFMAVEVLEKVKTKRSYKYLFYYSYYSFTIYLSHPFLYFLFPERFNFITIWIAIIIGNVLLGFLFRATYKTLGPKASLKVGISVISLKLAFKWSKLKFKSDKEKAR
ncbi:MAG: heparan-alpha-glucosaminide N-acetyltransferase domain-containing protein [Candidatus Hermodarchaeota archaeon]